MRPLLLVAFLFLALGAQRVESCTCGYQSVKAARYAADAVFAGKVEEVIVVDDAKTYEPRIIVRFSVGRVWKGNVPAQFTMHTYLEFSSCRGFFDELVEPGLELLVFARALPARDWKQDSPDFPSNANSMTVMSDERKMPARQDLLDALDDDSTVYSTNICSGSLMWEDAGYTVRELSGYTRPEGGYTMADPPPFDDSRIPGHLWKLPEVCWNVREGFEWRELEKQPSHAKTFERMMLDIPQYRESRNTTGGEPVDVWWHAAEGDRYGLCRMSSRDPRDCGGVAAMFARYKDEWRLDGIELDACVPAED